MYVHFNRNTVKWTRVSKQYNKNPAIYLLSDRMKVTRLSEYHLEARDNKTSLRGFPGDPVNKTSSFQCREHGFHALVRGPRSHMLHSVAKKKNKPAPTLSCACSVQFSHSVTFDSLQLHVLQYTRIPCPSSIPGACSYLYPLSRWCHSTISTSVVPFSSCLQSFQASGSFPMSQFFTSGGQSIGASASALVLPMNIQEWFPLGLTGLISLQSKGLSRVFSNTTVKKHQFFSAQPSFGPTLSSIHDYWENHGFDYTDFCWQNNISAF